MENSSNNNTFELLTNFSESFITLVKTVNRLALHIERIDKRQNEIITYLNSKMKDKQ